MFLLQSRCPIYDLFSKNKSIQYDIPEFTEDTRTKLNFSMLITKNSSVLDKTLKYFKSNERVQPYRIRFFKCHLNTTKTGKFCNPIQCKYNVNKPKPERED